MGQPDPFFFPVASQQAEPTAGSAETLAATPRCDDKAARPGTYPGQGKRPAACYGSFRISGALPSAVRWIAGTVCTSTREGCSWRCWPTAAGLRRRSQGAVPGSYVHYSPAHNPAPHRGRISRDRSGRPRRLHIQDVRHVEHGSFMSTTQQMLDACPKRQPGLTSLTCQPRLTVCVS